MMLSEVRKYTEIAALIILLLFMSAFTEAEPLETAFTYQGYLNDSNGLAAGDYDFQFSLYDSLSDGIQVGSTLQVDDVYVENGYFTVLLDFGLSVFVGQARYLEI